MRFKFTFIKQVYKYVLIYTYHLKKITLFKRQGNKRIIICMDGIMSHGGLVDRLKGIMSFYEIAKILNYDFYIQFNSPFKLEDYLNENTYNWRINESTIRWNFFSTKFLYLMNRFDLNPLEIIQKTKCKDIFVYSNVDYMPLIYKEENVLFCNKKINENFKELFNPNEVIQEYLIRYNKPRVVYHTRFTTLLGDFKDTTRLELPYDEQVQLINEVLKAIKQYSFKLKSNYEIYVLSDSISFLNFVKNNSDFKVLEGTPSHIDLKKTESNNVHIKTFLDFFFIVYCDKVFQVRRGNMYNSNFSKYAAIIGKKDYEVIN
jgi:hypothetical protein